MREGWGFAGTGHQVKGFMVPLLWPGILSCWSQPCLHPVDPLTQNEGGTQAPSGATQAWRSPARKEPALVPPLPHGGLFPNSGWVP